MHPLLLPMTHQMIPFDCCSDTRDLYSQKRTGAVRQYGAGKVGTGGDDDDGGGGGDGGGRGSDSGGGAPLSTRRASPASHTDTGADAGALTQHPGQLGLLLRFCFQAARDPSSSQSNPYLAFNAAHHCPTPPPPPRLKAFDSDEGAIAVIKQVWAGLVAAPPVDAVLQEHVTDVARLHANGTDKASFYRQLLAQFENPLLTGQRRALWLDRETALSLKGTASLALYPENAATTIAGAGAGEAQLSPSSTSTSTSQVLEMSRGVRLSAPLATASMLQVTFNRVYEQ